MAALTLAETLATEATAMAAGWSQEQLLKAAGEGLGVAIARYFPRPGSIIGYLGKGHNAGDALVALRTLRDQFGWEIAIRCAFPLADFAPLVSQQWIELGSPLPLDSAPRWRDLKYPLVLLDGLLGSGGAGPLRAPLIDLAEEMACLRQTAGARVAAVDLPSGIDPDSGEISPHTVTADVTFMIGNAKRGLLNGHAAAATGALAIVPVDALTLQQTGERELISPFTLACGKSPRPFNFHKGMAGRIAILAGSDAYSGAAVLAASGALRAGGGLIILFVPATAHAQISAKCPPEIIVRPIHHPLEVLEFRFDALAVGCGLGELTQPVAAGLLDLITHSNTPTVLDADALNLIARHNPAQIFTDRQVLTPHPGEFARLAPDLCDLPRESAARQFADRFPATLLLKGCRSLITRQGQPLWSNATGTPGMATGGQGDILTGVIAARLATGDSPVEAAALSAWLCGRSAEIALQQAHLSEQSLTPSDVLHFLGAAFKDWQCSRR
jgi:NAD(P)H-hydrate epimerase